ncbi:MAG TPA: substrate-binding domain-containing protein [Patescibacteria group bacterium]|nr:substrate-binding domain-containing protein [Patescibacteria group bacterium]
MARWITNEKTMGEDGITGCKNGVADRRVSLFPVSKYFTVFLVCWAVLAYAVPVKAAMFTLETYPRVDGATIAIPMGKLMAEKLIGKEQLAGSSGANVTAFKTTHNAYVNLITGQADIIFVFGPSDEETKLAETQHVKLRFTPIGKDAFVFLTNMENPVQELSLQQIQAIYAGKIVNWNEVGGNDEDIIAYQRNKNSGSQTFMEQRVMVDMPLVNTPVISSSMYDVIDAVYQKKTAIGYSFNYFANQMYKRGERVKFLAVDGRECSRENIRDEVYPLTVTLYAVTRVEDRVNDSVNKMLVWLDSEEGVSVIEEGGFIPLN